MHRSTLVDNSALLLLMFPPSYASSFIWLYTWSAASTLNMAMDSPASLSCANTYMLISVMASDTVRPNAAHTTTITPFIILGYSGDCETISHIGGVFRNTAFIYGFIALCETQWWRWVLRSTVMSIIRYNRACLFCIICYVTSGKQHGLQYISSNNNKCKRRQYTTLLVWVAGCHHDVTRRPWYVFYDHEGGWHLLGLWLTCLVCHRSFFSSCKDNKYAKCANQQQQQQQQLRSHLNVLTFSPLTGGCSEGLGAFWFFLKQLQLVVGGTSSKINTWWCRHVVQTAGQRRGQAYRSHNRGITNVKTATCRDDRMADFAEVCVT